jgi:hypothetical protein
MKPRVTWVYRYRAPALQIKRVEPASQDLALALSISQFVWPNPGMRLLTSSTPETFGQFEPLWAERRSCYRTRDSIGRTNIPVES